MENRLVAQTTHCAMGTVMTHKAFGVYAKEALAAVCREVSRIEERLSCFSPDSEISRVNRSAGKKSEKVTLNILTSNPCAQEVRFSCSLLEASYLDISVCDHSGKKVSSLASRTYGAGEHYFSWGTSDVPAGVYFLTVRGKESYSAQKIIVMK